MPTCFVCKNNLLNFCPIVLCIFLFHFRNRPFALSKSKSLNRADESLANLDLFVKEINRKSGASICEKVYSIFSMEDPHLQAKDLTKRSFSTQTLVIFEHLKRVITKIHISIEFFVRHGNISKDSIISLKKCEQTTFCFALMRLFYCV